MITLPRPSLPVVLDRIDQAWTPYTASNLLALAAVGAGKTTLIRAILARTCPQARVVAFLPKVAPGPSWTSGPHAPRLIPALTPGWGASGDGGGPAGRWYLRAASASTADTARRFHADMELLKSEGHAVVVLDDCRTLAKAYRGAESGRAGAGSGRAADRAGGGLRQASLRTPVRCLLTGAADLESPPVAEQGEYLHKHIALGRCRS